MEEILRELIDLVKEASPKVWSIYRQQVVVQATQDMIWAVFMIALIITGSYFARKIITKLIDNSYDWDDRETFTALAVIISIAILIGVLFLVISLTTITGYLLNPDYYVIQLLIKTAK